MKKKILFLVILIGSMILSGCKRKQDQVLVDDITKAITTTKAPLPPITPSLEPELPLTPTEAPISAETMNQNAGSLLTFKVQPITVPSEYKTPFMSKEDFPVLDGSTANIPLSEAIYCYLTGASKEEAKKDLKFYKTPDSYRRLMNKEADILFVYEPSQIILKEMLEQYAEFEFKPIGRDALVFIANESNPVSSLTQEEITKIYTGELTNWSELGGKDQEILPFQRPAASGSQTLMEKLAVPAASIMNGPQVVKPTEMGELINAIASYNNASNALGYSVYFYANYMYSKPGLKFMAIDSVMPTNETIQKGEYPYVNDFYVVIRKEEPKDSKARVLYDYMTTKEAQKLLTKAGYVPIVDMNATYTPSHKAVEIKGTLNLKPDQRLVEHNVTEEDVFEGDRLLTKDYQEMITFESKYIECGENWIFDSDLVLLKSYQTVLTDEFEYMRYVYELYSLSKKCYLTEHPYGQVIRTIEGFYYFYTSNYSTGKTEEVMFSPNGTFLCKATSTEKESAFLDVVKDHVVFIQGNVLTIYDKEGKRVKQLTLPYETVEKAYINTGYRYSNEDYLWLRVNQSYLVIYDKNGNLIKDQRFLKNVDLQHKIKGPWITNSIVGTDGHLYVVGEIERRLYILRDDGKVLLEENTTNNSYYITLYAHVFDIYNLSSQNNYYMGLDGELLNPDGAFCPQTNDAIILTKEDKFTVYPFHTADVYVVKDNSYDKNSFYGTEADTNPVMTWYAKVLPNGETQYKSNYLGLRSFEGYAMVKPVGDYFILDYDVEGRDTNQYELIDRRGNTIYKANAEEVISGVYFGEEIYLAVSAGNYEGIKDLEGNYLYREISDSHLDD